MAVAPSQEGGLIWCHFKGSPGAIEFLSYIEETDVNGVRVRYRDGPQWLSDRRAARGRMISDQNRACGRGEGLCYLREKGFQTERGRTYSVYRDYFFDRQCEARGGIDWYVHRQVDQTVMIRNPQEGEDRYLSTSDFERRFEIRFDIAGRPVEQLEYRQGQGAPEGTDGEWLEMHERVISTGVITAEICTGDPEGCALLMTESNGPSSSRRGRGWAYCQAYAQDYGAR
ncbi:MAG: hypothetical protein AAGI10_04260 [Pseudomonadota bacterium]